MNIAIGEGISDNFKIEIIYFLVNINHKFAIYYPNVKTPKVVQLNSAYTKMICIVHPLLHLFNGYQFMRWISFGVI